LEELAEFAEEDIALSASFVVTVAMACTA